jgi:hypothetical protein
MPDRRDELKSYLQEALKICNGNCSNCPTKDDVIVGDEELYVDKSVSQTLRERNINIAAGDLPKDVCTLAAALGTEIKNYGKNEDKSNYRPLITSAGRNLIYISVEGTDAAKFQKAMARLILDLESSKKDVPILEETKREPLKVPIMEIPKNRTSRRAQAFLY